MTSLARTRHPSMARQTKPPLRRTTSLGVPPPPRQSGPPPLEEEVEVLRRQLAGLDTRVAQLTRLVEERRPDYLQARAVLEGGALQENRVRDCGNIEAKEAIGRLKQKRIFCPLKGSVVPAKKNNMKMNIQ